jgi:hypothetical protein
MQAKNKVEPNVFESVELMSLIGIDLTHLNKLIERGQYGIKPSVRTGRGRGRRRLFSKEDALGAALAWWLFETGLRSAVIQYVLNQVCGGHLESTANDAARILIENEAKTLAITRLPRTAKDLKRVRPVQMVHFYDESKVAQLMETTTTAAIVLVIPVGKLFSILNKAMEEY